MTGGEFFGGMAIQYHSKDIDPKVFLIGSCFVISLGYFINGPCEYLPNSIILMGIGNFISGFAMCYQSVYSATELIKRTKEVCQAEVQVKNAQHPDGVHEPSDKDINGFCSGFLNCFIGIGQSLGPVYGAYMSKNFGFRFT
jgi:ATP-dependent protease ClpP protease subunit